MKIERLTIERRGSELGKAEKVLIMLHGRGDRAANFISLSEALDLVDFTILALQADGNTWYPHSFLADRKSNEPYLTNSLGSVDRLVQHVKSAGFDSDQIYFLGFSQGACLTLEYAAQNVEPYGGIIAFTGGLIGEKPDSSRYQGDFKGTSIFIGSSDFDPHVPEIRINESVEIIRELGGNVSKIIYQGMGHTINQDEIEKAKEILNRKRNKS